MKYPVHVLLLSLSFLGLIGCIGCGTFFLLDGFKARSAIAAHRIIDEVTDERLYDLEEVAGANSNKRKRQKLKIISIMWIAGGGSLLFCGFLYTIHIYTIVSGFIRSSKRA